MRSPKIVLNEKRLSEKMDIFKKYCLKGLINQKLKNGVIVILKTSDNLPQKYKDELQEIIKENTFIKIQEYSSKTGSYADSLNNSHLNEFIEPTTKIIATSRLDDDDHIFPLFTTIIRKYITADNIHKIINFPNGYSLNTRRNEKVPWSKPDHAVGMTMVQKVGDYKTYPYGVYSGNHTHWKNKVKMILPREIMFIRTLHGSNDSNIKG